jgi:hypothetical protein
MYRYDGVHSNSDKYCLFGQRGQYINPIPTHDDSKAVRKILRKHVFSTADYAMTNLYIDVNGEKKRTTRRFHQRFLDYDNNMVTDHTNRYRYDNRRSNLRIVSQHENVRNISKRKDNTSGINGVRYVQSRNAWRVYITDTTNKRISKTFSSNKYADAKHLAIAWRKEKEQEFGYIGE